MGKIIISFFLILLVSIIFVAVAPQNVESHVFKTSNNILSIDPDVDWWKTAVIYQVFPKSFKDSNNDGNGDLQVFTSSLYNAERVLFNCLTNPSSLKMKASTFETCVIEKLDYFKETGVDAIWLNPIFKSPQVDTGYDISDYRDIDPIYGTLDDLKQLIDEAHKLNIKVLLDYVPNHTSDQHNWFQASLNGDSQYADYYIWKNATYVDGARTPPNNWISCYSGPAWEWDEGRQQYYFHQFSTGQPDLNYRNPAVVEEMKDVLRYWLNFGADGFRMDAVTTLFEDILLQDEPESAWEWDEGRQQYYFHQFSTGQPDLNYRNPAVVEEMKDVLRYWLNFGADGFRMDAVTTLFEDILLQDEPESGTTGLTPNDHGYLSHIYTLDQPESFEMLYQWRNVIDQFNRENNTYTRIMITEGNADPDMIKLFYGEENGIRLGAHFTFNFISFLSQLHTNFTAFDLVWSIETWMEAVPSWGTDNWLLGNHDNTRVSTRLGVENIDGLNMVVSFLPGAQITYQGEEIGQENGNVTCDEGTDPQAIKNCSTFASISRDFERTPFQWDNSTNAGFNDGAKTWLPVSEKYVGTNLADQNIADINSHYNIYKQMIKIKQELLESPLIQVKNDMDGNIYCFQRITENANYVVYFNVGDTEATINTKGPMKGCTVCEDCMTVAVRSLNSEYLLGDTFNASQPFKPREAVVNIVVL